MKLLLDDANIKNIKEVYEYYKIDGVTTNPTILSKQGEKTIRSAKENQKLYKR